MQESEFEIMLKQARNLGAAQGFDRVRTRLDANQGDPHAFEKVAFGQLASKATPMLKNIGSKFYTKGKAPVMTRDGLNIAVPGTKGGFTPLAKNIGLYGGGTALTGAGFYGGAQHGKEKTIQGMEDYMNNQGFMDKLKMIWAYLSGGGTGVVNQMGLRGGGSGNVSDLSST